jgi:hypothetical protein
MSSRSLLAGSPPVGAHVLGVVRSSTCLETVRYVVGEPAEREQPWRIEHAIELSLPPADSPLWPAWRALEVVTRWDATTLAHVLTVLRGTVPSADAAPDLPALGAEVLPPRPPRATAAHPRAFRGTKHRPPRAPQPKAVDVRPYLLARRHIDQVLELCGQPRGVDPYLS